MYRIRYNVYKSNDYAIVGNISSLLYDVKINKQGGEFHEKVLSKW